MDALFLRCFSRNKFNLMDQLVMHSPGEFSKVGESLIESVLNKTGRTCRYLMRLVMSDTRKLELEVVGGEEERWDTLESLRLSQDYIEATGIKKEISIIRVKKPHRQEFIRVHPEWFLETMIFVDQDEKSHHIVNPAQYNLLEGELVPKILYPYINIKRVLKLWPIRLPDAEGKLDDWNRSALKAAKIAQEKWVRVASNRALGAYEVFYPLGSVDEPEWPEIDLQTIVDVAFKDFRIDDENHPIIKGLGLSHGVKVGE